MIMGNKVFPGAYIDIAIKLTARFNFLFNTSEVDLQELIFSFFFICYFQGPLKTETAKNLEKYVIKDDRLPVLLDRYGNLLYFFWT